MSLFGYHYVVDVDSEIGDAVGSTGGTGAIFHCVSCISQLVSPFDMWPRGVLDGPCSLQHVRSNVFAKASAEDFRDRQGQVDSSGGHLHYRVSNFNCTCGLASPSLVLEGRYNP